MKPKERKNVSVFVPAHNALKRYCARTGLKVQDVASAAIVAYIKAQGKK